jgi:hypothetical protein
MQAPDVENGVKNEMRSGTDSANPDKEKREACNNNRPSTVCKLKLKRAGSRIQSNRVEKVPKKVTYADIVKRSVTASAVGWYWCYRRMMV